MHGQQDRDGAQRMLGLHAFESPVSSQQTWQTQQWLSALGQRLRSRRQSHIGLAGDVRGDVSVGQRRCLFV